MGAEVGKHTVGTSSAPLTPDSLSPSAGRGEGTHRGYVLQPVLGLIKKRERLKLSRFGNHDYNDLHQLKLRGL
jgi:hypothetical protein